MLKKLFSYQIASVFALVMFSLLGCSNEKNLPTKGSFIAYVDESVYPLMLSEKNSFVHNFNEANIEVVPIAADDGIKKFMNGEINFFISSRYFNSNEKQFINTKIVDAAIYTYCYGGVAVITSVKSNIKSITSVEVQNFLIGKNKSREIFIPPKNSGVYGFLKQDFLEDAEPVSANLAASEKDVIEKTKNNINSIGLVGFNIISDTSEIRILPLGMLNYSTNKVQYYSPGSLTFDTYYPLSRQIYLFLNDEKKGLASGFATFLLSQEGQKIVQNNNLSPTNYNIEIVKIK
jgi:ABC-type phosphate transport system substrate-binding protein